MQPLTKLDTIGVEYIGAKCAKGRVVFLRLRFAFVLGVKNPRGKILPEKLTSARTPNWLGKGQTK